MCVCIRRTEVNTSKMSWQTVATIALPLLVQNTKIKNRFIQNYALYFASEFICQNNEKKNSARILVKTLENVIFRIKKRGDKILTHSGRSWTFDSEIVI